MNSVIDCQVKVPSVQVKKKEMKIAEKPKLSATKETETLMNGYLLNTFLTKYSKSIEEQYSEKKTTSKFCFEKKNPHLPQM